MWTDGAAAAGERGARFVDRYNRCLDRLADPREHQRIGAMRALEALAQAAPEHAQSVVDVLCAYLRSPADAGDRAARATAQRVVTAHLRPGSRFWPRMRIDLAGAVIIDLDLSECRISTLSLDGAILYGATKVRGAEIEGPLWARRATFTDQAWFERSTLGGQFRAEGANFAGDAWFGATQFRETATFVGATFGGHAWFGRCDAAGRVDFADAVFRRSAGFRGAVFRGGVGLAGTTFLGPARVSRGADDGWNLAAPGWATLVDPDNEGVGQLIWTGTAHLAEATNSL
jgi:hypothetical protein